MCRSAFSLFEHHLLTIRHTKTNAFAELSEEEMISSPEYGSDLENFYGRCIKATGWDDFLVVIRVYDTHLPYGRGVSPCDAPSQLEIRKKVAALFSEGAGYNLLLGVAEQSLERALNYLKALWAEVSSRLDFVAIMSDHGDNWTDDFAQVGHAQFLTHPVLHVPLIVIDYKHSGRCWTYCNNVDVLPTLADATNKTVDWKIDGIKLPLDGTPRLGFKTEANSTLGKFLAASISPN